MRTRFVTTAVLILALTAATPASAGGTGGSRGSTLRLELRDRCDPATFNEFFFPDVVCIPHKDAEVTVAEFLDELNPEDFGHDKWRNNPDATYIRTGDKIKVVVRGGEFHTFTETEAFGPGCVPEINEALGLVGDAGALCALIPETGVAPGESLTVSGLSKGTHLFFCLIHPWMTSKIKVS